MENYIKLYGKPNCQGCDQAKALLASKGLGYEYVDVMRSDSAKELFRANGFRSVPQVYVNSVHIGGFEELKANLSGE